MEKQNKEDKDVAEAEEDKDIVEDKDEGTERN